MKIGLLEDNPSNREYMETMLTLAGHQVISYGEATSFLAALATAHQQHDFPPYTFAILDIMLPGPISGLDVIQLIWETYPPAERLPLIVISGAGPIVLEEVRARFPTIPVIRKPFKMHELFTAIDTLGIAGETL